ncbi:MAG: phosphoribosylformimino-5-aminoimidazole carboxamide ribotide isomerase [Huintestinicola sp.]
MRFRPCIDIHNGCVKQIVGGSLADKNSAAIDNFVSEYDGGYYAALYKGMGLKGGHIIILNPAGSEYYEADRKQAFSALAEYPMGMQIGGGVNAENVGEYLEKGASHVIVTSYVFKNGEISFPRLDEMVREAGKDRLVLDLSCRKKDGKYFIVTDRWQKFTDMEVTRENILMLRDYCDEFLIHAVDAEGKQKGIEEDIAALLGGIPEVTSTYAGGIGSFDDLEKLKKLGNDRVDFTVGSALDIFGGTMKLERVCDFGR